MSVSLRHNPLHFWQVQLLLCLALGAVLSVFAGQDVNWDLRNYHISTAWRLLNGRFDSDIFPADFQSAYNPTLDFPYVLLAMGPFANYPRALAAFMGLWFGLLVFITLRVVEILFSSFPKTERLYLSLLGTLTAVTGAAVFSQVGTTTGDIPVGVFILGGFACVLKALAPRQAPPDKKLLLLGGALFGFIAGCKLTGCIYAPALCLALLAVLPFAAWLRGCVLFSAAWIVAFLPPFGWWGWMMWARYGSPTFPLLNNIFRAPGAPPISVMDVHFLPRDILQWLFYPFYWAWDARSIVSEVAFRDPRMAIAYVALAAALIAYAARRFAPGAARKDSKADFTAPQRVAMLFLALSYVAWLVTASIYRYVLPVEVLSIPCAIVVLHSLIQRFWRGRKKGRAVAILATLVCVVTLASTVHIPWGRPDYGEKVFDVDMSWTKPDTLFVSVIGPVAYLEAFVPPEDHARFVGFGYVGIGGYGWPLGQAIEKAVENNKGPIVVLFTADMKFILPKLPLIGVEADLNHCRKVASNLDEPLNMPVFACDGKRVPPHRP